MWRPVELLREAVGNIGARQIGHTLMLSVLILAVNHAHVTTLNSTLAQEQALRDAGSLVWVARSQTDSLPGRACEALNGVTGVAAAGGARRGTPDQLVLATTGQPVALLRVTPNAVRVWSEHPAAQGVLLGTAYAGQGIAAIGTELREATTGHLLRVAATVPAPGTDLLDSNLVVVGTPDQLLSECWVRMLPTATFDTGEALLAHTFGGSETQIAPALPASTQLLSPSGQWQAFRNLRLWAIAGLIGGMAFAFLTRTRRTELAVYATFGTSPGELRTLLAIEACVGHAAAWAMGTSWALLLAQLSGYALPEVAVTLLRTSLLTAFTSLAVSVILILGQRRGNLLDSLKNR